VFYFESQSLVVDLLRGIVFLYLDWFNKFLVKIHCIPGLGADHRVFQNLHIKNAELMPVAWPYFDKHDDLNCYAQKIAASIPNTPDDVVLGMSFGGMLASEIKRMRPEQQVLIVSSNKLPEERPDMGGFFKFLGKHGLMPFGLAKYAGAVLYKRFGAKTSEEKELLHSFFENTDPHFFNCAMRSILEWQTRTPLPPGLVHIHGTSDQILPPDLIHDAYWIEGGEHIMICNRAEEVSSLINEHLGV